MNGFDLFSKEKDVVAIKLDDNLFDMSHELNDDEAKRAQPVMLDSDDGIHVLRHSTAHILAQAIQNLYPDAKLGIGPVIEDGFYYDFGNTPAFTPDDLKTIEKEMLRIINSKQTFNRREVLKSEAEQELANEPFKLELIKKYDKITIYDNVITSPNEKADNNLETKNGSAKTVWKDLCKGPHLPNTKFIANNFKLTRTSAAYWLGNESNPSMQRVYGTAWQSKEKLNQYLQFLEEVKKRDHRRLGTELDLFSFPKELGAGLSVFHPKGGLIRSVMEEYSRQKHLAAGYSFVNTPHISKSDLYETSGHLGWYSDAMYPPMQLDDEGADYYLKPMNCPMHILIYRSRGRSYRELPLRLFEFGTVYRFEKSGVIHGLTRDRGFTQDDAHIFCTHENMEEELTNLLQFMLDLLRDYGLNDFYLEISTKDPKKSVGSDEIWQSATDTLVKVAQNSGLDLVLDEGGAAFYGPKISVQIKDALKRHWQLSTIQLDFNLPMRFELEYQASDGSRQRPVMIHRALFGSIERFFAILVEHYAGRFPAWLAPVQVLCIPVSDEHIEYLQKLCRQLNARGIRTEIDTSDDRFPKKIRNSSKVKAPFVLIAGDTDRDAETISFRMQDGTQENGIELNAAIERIVKKCQSPNNRG